jgi:hypothetical protein
MEPSTNVYELPSTRCLEVRRYRSSQYPEGPALTGHLGTGFFLVSLCLKANADMAPKTPKLLLHAPHVALLT